MDAGGEGHNNCKFVQLEDAKHFLWIQGLLSLYENWSLERYFDSYSNYNYFLCIFDNLNLPHWVKSEHQFNNKYAESLIAHLLKIKVQFSRVDRRCL